MKKIHIFLGYPKDHLLALPVGVSKLENLEEELGVPEPDPLEMTALTGFDEVALSTLAHRIVEGHRKAVLEYQERPGRKNIVNDSISLASGIRLWMFHLKISFASTRDKILPDVQ